jgi:hypothetical protein
MNHLRDVQFWLAFVLVLITIFLSIVTYLRFFNLNFFIGPFRFTHWLSLIGTIFIAIFTPVYYILKRKRPKNFGTMLKIHVFGNLLSFLLISIHFAQQAGRPPRFYPDLGTGLVLYILMPLLVISGFLHRFRVVKSLKPHINRYYHTSLTLSLYIVIFVHALQGFNVI